MNVFFIIVSFVLGYLVGVLSCKFISGSTSFTFKVNENKKPRESEDYWLLDDHGDNYLFTDSEISKAKQRASRNPEDLA